MNDPEHKTIDLETWHELCRRREAGQTIELPDEPLRRPPIDAEPPGRLLGREINRQIEWQLKMLPYALALMVCLGLVIMLLFVLF